MNVSVNALRFVGCAIAISAFLFASGSLSSGCGSASTGAGSDAGDSGTGGNTFHVDISLTSGLITFPNKYSGWAVGGSSATNFVAYPSGWSVGGGSATNFIAVPAGWSVGGGSATNFVAYAPGWVVGGGSSTNFITYPGPAVATIQVKFDDPGWLGLLKALQDGGSYSESTLADIVIYAFLNVRAAAPHRVEAPAGEW